MNNNWFLWNGVDSRSLGIIVDQYPALTRPKERVDSIVIPGRQGALYFAEADEPMYETFIMNVPCFLAKNASPGVVARFLSGSGTLVLGCFPDRAVEARIVNKLDYNILLFHRKQMSFTIPFECQPLRLEYPETSRVLSTRTVGGEEVRSGFVTNVGDFTAHPVYRLYSDFTVETYTLTVGNTTITVSMEGAEEEEEAGYAERRLLIDTDAYIVENLNTGVEIMTSTTIDGDGMEGLYFPLGDSEVSWGEGITRVEIFPRWRWYL